MTKEEYENQFSSDDLAEFEKAAASKGMTGHQLAEYLSADAINNFNKLSDQVELEPPKPLVHGNVIHVEFCSAQRRKHRRTFRAEKSQIPSDILFYSPTRVSSTSPTANPATVSSTSLDTGFPYSGR